MKKWIVSIVGLCWWASVMAQDPGFQLEGIGSALVPVTINKMTNLVFPETIQSGVKVSKDIMAAKVKGVENVLEIKAARVGFVPTNLSVYGRDGQLYSFVLRYVEDTSVLNYRVMVVDRSDRAPVMLTGLPASETKLREDAASLDAMRPFLGVAGRSEGLWLGLSGIWLRDSLQWLVVRLRNRSVLPFIPERWRIFLQDRKAVRRRAVQEVGVEPVFASELGLVGGKGKAGWAAGFTPFVVPVGKRLVVEVVGKDGRAVRILVKGRLFKKMRE